jgi:hypothetical protein
MMLLDVFLEGLFEMDLRRVNSEEVRGTGGMVMGTVNTPLVEGLLGANPGGLEGQPSGGTPHKCCPLPQHCCDS